MSRVGYENGLPILRVPTGDHAICSVELTPDALEWLITLVEHGRNEDGFLRDLEELRDECKQHLWNEARS